MENDATQPGPDGLNESPEAIAARLKALEEEAAALRASLEAKAAEPAAEPEPEPEPEPLAPATPAQIAEAEKALAAARVAKMRGQKQEADRLLEQAQKAAPTAPTVLEAIGDDYAERGQTKKAMDAYKRAHELDPKNIAIERKYAECVLKNDAVANAMMHMLGEDSIETVANANIATVLSVFVPGLGQMVTGQVPKGATFLGGWLIGWIWAFLTPDGLTNLVKSVGGAKSSFNTFVLVPVFIALVFHMAAIYDAASRAKSARRPKVNRPVPPANLPFE